MKILILAQTPPPFHGQAIMQKYLVDAKWNWCEKIHIRLNYSNEISEVGKFKFSKVLSLVRVVFLVWKERMKGKIDLIYYPPSGPNRIPFYRDIITLLLIKWTAQKIIFHFHAGGINNLLNELNPFENYLAEVTLQKPDASIILLESLKKEIGWFNSHATYVIPNGIPDIPQKFIERNNNKTICLLTVGLITAEKGIFTILETAKILKEAGVNFNWNIMGEFVSDGVQKKCFMIVNKYNLNKNIKFLGVKKNNDKWKYYEKAEIYASLSFAAEAFPVTLLEAMMYSLPVVATDWRGIPEIVEDGKSGFLVPVQNPEAVAEHIRILINNPSLRIQMGKRGREIFLEKYTLDNHLILMEKTFKKVIGIEL